MSRPHTLGGRDAYAHTKPGKGPVWSSQGGGRGLSQYEPWVAKYNAFAKKHGKSIPPIQMGGNNKWAARSRINLSKPEWSPVILNNLAKKAGGRADDNKSFFKSKEDPKYKELMAILTEAKAALYRLPRMDMEGGKAIPQDRNFGRVFGAR
jgi:hypothetical protein